jgi:hypothetical protein
VDWIESGRSMCLTNPANPKESICERWEQNPKSFREFVSSVTEFRDRWERLLKIVGIPDIEAELSDLFDEAPVRWAIKQFTQHSIGAPRDERKLRITPSGSLGMTAAAASLLVPRNTNFGN